MPRKAKPSKPKTAPKKSSPRKRRNTSLAPSRDTTAFKLEYAYSQLGLVPDSNPPTLLTPALIRSVPQITPILKQSFKRGVPEAIEYIRMSGSDNARKFLKLYDSLPGRAQKVVPIEAYCIMLKMAPVKLLSVIMEACFNANDDTSILMASIAKPRIVEKAVEAALTDEGFKDRQMLLQHGGFLPQNKNQTVYIREQKVNVAGNIDASKQITVGVGELNRIEDDMLSITSRYDESIGLKRELPPAVEPAIDIEAKPLEPEPPLVEFDEPDVTDYLGTDAG